MVEPRQQEALAALYRALKGVFTVACHWTRERAAAEDAVHDVFAVMARPAAVLPSFQSENDARRYLVRAVVHRVQDSRRRRRPESAEGARLAAEPAAGGDPFAAAVAADEATRLRALLRSLPDEQRQVVVLHLHGGLKFREVAELMQIPLDTATTRYRAALKKLSSWLCAQRVKE
ncbi:MAG: sigma-70 family RNA polymerase sigma factor [Planctomycetes bacterium]|nr:sigma-70 family RNA polymerase sigma factor [Planctomycetota bacterium]